MNFRPLYDRVLLKRVEAETKTSSGLIIPDAAKEKPMEAEVVAIGNGRVNKDGSVREMSLSVGDRVIFRQFSGTKMEWMGVDYLLIQEEDIQAKVME